MKQRLGRWGEEKAAAFLIGKGYQLVEKNWRARPGEIDLVMKDGDDVVFIEVKTRSGIGFGYPEEAITDKKMSSLTECCQKYIDQNELDADWRIEAVSIIGNEKVGVKDIRHIQDF